MSQIIRTHLSRLAAFDVLVGAATTTRSRIIPFGLVQSANGPFTLDDEGAIKVVEDFKKHGVDLIVDWDHLSLFGSKPGDSKAAGWIRHPNGLEYVRGDGIYATIEWTQEAADAIRKLEYKYLSPTIFLRQTAPPRVVGLESVGLVNKPAIPDMPALAASRNPHLQENAMTEQQLKELRDALKPHATIADDADGATVTATFKKVVSTVNGHDAAIANHVRSTLGLPESASKDAVVVALATLSTAAKEVEAMKAKDAEHAKKAREQTRDELIDWAVKENRLVKSDAVAFEAARKLALESPDQFKAIMQGVKPTIPHGRTEPPTQPTEATGDAQEKMIADAMSANGNNYVAALSSLQRQLMTKYTEQGFSNKYAREKCQAEYPKIFS